MGTCHRIERLAAFSFSCALLLGVAACSSGGGSPAAEDVGSANLLDVAPLEGLQVAGLEGGSFFPLSKSYQFTNTGTGVLDWMAQSDSDDVVFLPEEGILSPGGTTSVSVFVSSDALANYAPGVFVLDAQIVEVGSTAPPIELPVTVFVAETGELDVVPAIGYSVNGLVGESFTPTSTDYVLSNTGIGPLAWEAGAVPSWMDVAPNSGTLDAGEQVTVTTTVDAAVAASLGVGVYAEPLNFREVQAGVTGLDLLMSLEVERPGTMVVTPEGRFRTGGPAGGPFAVSSTSYSITNIGDRDMPWSVASDSGLFLAQPTSGVLAPGGQATVEVAVDAMATTDLEADNYDAELSFTNVNWPSEGSTVRPMTVDVILERPDLVLTQSAVIAPVGPEGGPFSPSFSQYELTNVGNIATPWNVTVDVPWLSVFPSTGSLAPGDSITLTVDLLDDIAERLDKGIYEGLLQVTGSHGFDASRRATLTVLDDEFQSLAPRAVEGPGFSGPTPEPAAIGTGPASTFHPIAMFDCVPWQEFSQPFELGVPAFHHRGIDRVEFSVEGGPWVPVFEPSLNPRTGVVEYWIYVDPGEPVMDVNRELEIRAVAYPIAGQPRVVKPIVLNARPNGVAPIARYVSLDGDDVNGNGSTSAPYRTIARAAHDAFAQSTLATSNPVVRLFPGDYVLAPPQNQTIVNLNRWLYVEPAEGVSRSEVRIVDAEVFGVKVVNLAFRNITFRTQIFGANLQASHWFHRCLHKGDGAEVFFQVGWSVSTLDDYWTDGLLCDSRWGPMVGLVRGMTIRNIGEDAFNGANPVINTTIDRVDRGVQSDWHPDLFKHHESLDNTLYYGVRATNVAAQGLFWKFTQNPYRQNHAIINVLIDGREGFKSQLDCRFDHLVMRHCTLNQQFVWRASDQGNHAFENNLFSSMIAGNSSDPANFGFATVDSIQINGTFRNNHYFEPGNTILPGTGVTEWTVDFADLDGDDYRPLRNQGLRRGEDLLPVDIHGLRRHVPSTLGAIAD